MGKDSDEKRMLKIGDLLVRKLIHCT